MTKKETNRLDKLWREGIHERDNETCQVCGNPGNNAHHIIGRRNRRLRWDLRNGIILCAGDHTFKTQSAHQDPLWFTDWFYNHYPEQYDYLMTKRNDIFKGSLDDALKILEESREK